MHHTADPTATASRKPSKELVAAAAVPLLLSILAAGDSYGYAIGQRGRELTDGEMDWAEGMLYPILHRLEQRGLIASYWGTAENGRKRRYYRLLPAGREELEIQRAHWQRFHRMLNELEPGLGPKESGHDRPRP